MKAASILIVLMGSLGDVARGLCIVSAIKKSFPACRIAWLVEPRCAELVAAHPQIDEVLIFDRPRGFKALGALFSQLRSRRFDVSLDMQRHLKSGVFSFLSAAPRRIGFHWRNAKEFNWVFNNEHIPYAPSRRPKIESYLQFAAQIGAGSSKVDFGIPVDAFSAKLPGAARKPYALLVLGSSRPEKNWSAAGYRRLIELVLQQASLNVMLAGDASASVLGAELKAAYPGPEVQDFAGKTTLPELVALVSQARVCAGPDSGPGHVAAMFGVPYISLFGSTDPDRVAPYGMRHLVVQAPAGSFRGRKAGLAQIPAELVFLRLKDGLAAGT